MNGKPPILRDSSVGLISTEHLHCHQKSGMSLTTDCSACLARLDLYVQLIGDVCLEHFDSISSRKRNVFLHSQTWFHTFQQLHLDHLLVSCHTMSLLAQTQLRFLFLSLLTFLCPAFIVVPCSTFLRSFAIPDSCAKC